MPDEKIKLAADAEMRRVVMCSGKVYYDLYEEREKRGIEDVYLLPVEQLYPVPLKALVQALSPLHQGRDGVVPGGAAQHGRVTLHASPISNGCSTRLGTRGEARRYAGRPASAAPAIGRAVAASPQLKRAR